MSSFIPKYDGYQYLPWIISLNSFSNDSAFMTTNLSGQIRLDSEIKPLAPIIPISPARVAPEKQAEKICPQAIKNEIPLFYTQPIFKAKKYDFL